MRRLAQILALLVLFHAPAAVAQEAPATSLKGKFLVADPAMPDARFAGAVIFIIAHSPEGAVGIVINRPGATRALKDVMRAFDLPPAESKVETMLDLNWGGPVQGDLVFMLHDDAYKTTSTSAIAPGIALSHPKDVLGDVAAGRGPRRYLLAVGYAGWSAGQLDREMTTKSWAVVSGTADLLFDGDAAGKWQRAWALRSQDL